jgi:murein DD-endopeptidase MepM/ murein hydrolase activator NlpD
MKSMNRNLFLLSLCLLLVNWAEAQNAKVFQEHTNTDFVLYATNPDLFPVSVRLEFSNTNLSFSEGEKTIFVIPPKSEKFKIGELSPSVPRTGFRLSYKYKTAMGDVTTAVQDESIEYDLPFRKGTSYKVVQGYNGSQSHRDENALDFDFPEGTEIIAAREGVIVQVVQNHTESCPYSDCNQYNNIITVMHADGTFATYAHIKYNGAKFNVGDSVKRGDVIALSSDVGYTSGPHLHFVCYTGGFNKRNTLRTRFKTSNGDRSEELIEGKTYNKNY